MRSIVLRLLFVLSVVLLLAVYFRPLEMSAQQPPPGAPASTPAPNVPAAQAIPVQTVPSPVSPSHVPETVQYGLMAAFVIQYLKKAKWFSVLSEESTSKVKAWFGFWVALLTAAGIHFGVTGNFLDGTGATLTITGLSFDVVKDLLFQWVAQQSWYLAVVKGS